MTPFETITLYIDNSAPVLARVLYQIRQAIKADHYPPTAVEVYIKVSAASDMRLHGDKQDRENAGRIHSAAQKATESDWGEIATHFMAQHKEGARMLEYLPEEMR